VIGFPLLFETQPRPIPVTSRSRSAQGRRAVVAAAAAAQCFIGRCGQCARQQWRDHRTQHEPRHDAASGVVTTAPRTETAARNESPSRSEPTTRSEPRHAATPQWPTTGAEAGRQTRSAQQ